MSLFFDINEANRSIWLNKVLTGLPAGIRILDAGAGELRNKQNCKHLAYVSQDFCQYEGKGNMVGLQTGNWDTSKIDIVCDITSIPEPDQSFDAILCSEVFEHVPDPTLAIQEFFRLLKPGGKLILTAPFASLVHFAPFHFCSGFSKYWYEHHLPKLGFSIVELTANGDWYSFCEQEIYRLPKMEKSKGILTWPIAALLSALLLLYFRIRPKIIEQETACFGYHCIAIKKLE